MVRLLVLLFSFLFSISASARVFDLSNRSFATYFSGEIGPSNLGKQPWGDSSGAATSTDKSVRLNYSGEVGFLVAMPKLNFRLGVEFLQPQHIGDVIGSDASSAQLFSLDSTTRAFIPKATLEMVVKKGKDSALMFGASIGYAMVTMTNAYTMTALGNTQLGTTGNFEEKGEGTAISGEGFLGYEFIFSDNVTLLATAGYRYLLVGTLKHQNAVTVIGGSSVAKGSTVKNQNGDDRMLNLSSANAGLNFRFYF